MIYLVDGTPGAGKTYFAIRKIVDALASDKFVVTNVGLSDRVYEAAARANPMRRLSRRAVRKRAELLRTRVLISTDLEDLMRVRVEGKREGRAVMVLDEAHEFLNARTWSKNTQSGVIKWFSKHRHYGFDCYLISQYIDDIDKQVRNRVEYRVRLRNLNRVRILGLRIIPFNYFAAITELYSAKQAPTAGREFYTLKKRIAGLYDTHALALLDAPGDVIWLPRSLPPHQPPADVPSAAASELDAPTTRNADAGTSALLPPTDCDSADGASPG